MLLMHKEKRLFEKLESCVGKDSGPRPIPAIPPIFVLENIFEEESLEQPKIKLRTVTAVRLVADSKVKYSNPRKPLV